VSRRKAERREADSIHTRKNAQGRSKESFPLIGSAARNEPHALRRPRGRWEKEKSREEEWKKKLVMGSGSRSLIHTSPYNQK